MVVSCLVLAMIFFSISIKIPAIQIQAKTMQSLTQIRDLETKGQKQIEAAQKDAQKIITDARIKESAIRAKIASELR